MEPSSNITSYTNSSLAAITVTGMDLSTARRAGQSRRRRQQSRACSGGGAYFLPLVLRAANPPAGYLNAGVCCRGMQG